MIARALKAFRVAAAAAQAVLVDERVVIVRELQSAELCSCPRPRVVLMHEPGTYCGDDQWTAIARAATEAVASAGWDEVTPTAGIDVAVEGVMAVLLGGRESAGGAQ